MVVLLADRLTIELIDLISPAWLDGAFVNCNNAGEVSYFLRQLQVVEIKDDTHALVHASPCSCNSPQSANPPSSSALSRMTSRRTRSLRVSLGNPYRLISSLTLAITAVGAAFLTQKCRLEDKVIKFEIWDTAGQERFHRYAVDADF